MSEPFTDPAIPPPESEMAPPRCRNWAWLAWIVIIGLAALMVLGHTEDEKREATRERNLAGLLMKMQGRYLVGAEEVFHQKAFYKSAQAFRKGDVDQRLRFVVLANELAGPAEALKELKRLDQDLAEYKVRLSPDQVRLRSLLGRLYLDYSHMMLKAPSLSAEDRVFLRQHLDWFGKLALAPAGIQVTEDRITSLAGGAAAVAILAQGQAPDPDGRQAVLAPAQRTFVVLIGTVMLMLLVGLAGFIGLIVLLVFVFTGKIMGMQTGTGRGGIYAETFAVWFILFAGQSFVLGRLALGVPPLIQVAAMMFLSLVALGWPVLRGISWRQVRDDLGLNLGRKPLLEPIIGLGCYAMAIPIVALGLVATLLLLQVQGSMSEGAGNPFAPTDFPSHPIVESLAHGGWPELLGVIFLASVAAPLIEETMFRGVLYRHLREASARFGPVLSFLASALVVSFLFAVLHPQGLFAVPVLMALAIGFSMAREWRGSLVPCMVGHALNNGIVTLVLAVALGD